MGKDIFSMYPILKFVIGFFSILLGVWICKKNKFYKYDTDDMLFPATLKMFMSGLLLILIGICAFVSYFFGVF